MLEEVIRELKRLEREPVRLPVAADAHREGIFDNQYIERTGDTRYAPGQRIVVRPEHVVKLVALVRKLIGAYLPARGEA